MALHLRIAGRVQGVGYRAGFAAHARMLGLSGWVRNRKDGSVEALVQGAPQAVHEMTQWARQGPPRSRVDEVLLDEASDLPDREAAFEILPTE